MEQKVTKSVNLSKARVLVTGGSGFLGSAIVEELLNQGAVVTVLDNLSSGKREYLPADAGVNLIKGDITIMKDVKLALQGIDYVNHAAALPFIPDSFLHPAEFFDVNVGGTINMLLCCSEAGSLRRFVHISSSEVYGTAKETPMSEDHPTLPQSTYAVSKLAAERAAFTMHKEHDIPLTIIRPFNCYGPNITQPYIIPEIINQLLVGPHCVLGNVNTRRDMTYVTDTAKGIVLALTAQMVEGQTINLGSGRDLSVQELADEIGGILEYHPEIEFDSSRTRPFDVERLICDNSRAKELLGWMPTVPLNVGLRQTIDWIRDNGVEFKEPFKGWRRSYSGGMKLVDEVKG